MKIHTKSVTKSLRGEAVIPNPYIGELASQAGKWPERGEHAGVVVDSRCQPVFDDMNF
jgi:hypothetical protein